jgi:hypothetical protein
MSEPMPVCPENLNLKFLNELVREMHPGVNVESYEILQVKKLGEANVSTSTRASLKLKYGGDGAQLLPSNVIAKMSMGEEATEDIWCGKVVPVL